MRINKSLWWGAMPWEQDGGAVVNYYLLRKLNYLDPDHQFYCVPKVPEQADTESLPFAEFKAVKMDDITFKAIPEFMYMNDIPLLSIFHLSHEWIKMAKYVKEIGGKTIVHQTIHWESDDVFKSKALNDVDGWIVPTKWGAEVLSRVGKIEGGKIRYIPHGVDLQKFFPHRTTFRESMKLDDKQKVILFVGRCSLFKGAHQIIPVMKKLVDEYNCVFVIRAGAFSKEDMKIAHIFDLLAHQREKNIYFLPDWYPPEYVQEVFASADILLQPSGHEGFDVPLIEGMATRLAIAVSNIPNHWEILGQKDRHCGIFMEPTVKVGEVNDGKQAIKVPSSNMIYGTLKYLLENPDEANFFAKQAYRMAKQYDLNMVGREWLKSIYGIFPKGYKMRLNL